MTGIVRVFTPAKPAVAPTGEAQIITAQQPRPLTDSAGKPLPVPIFPKVQVLKLTLPLGTFSANEKVWKLLNEDAIDGRTATLLAQNGLRAATAAQAKWPEIFKLINVPGVSTDEHKIQTDNRSSVTIVTHMGIASQTIFFVDSDLHLEGRTFDESTNSIRLSLSQMKPGGAITIQLEPVVQLPPGPPPGRFTKPENIVSNEITFANLRIAAPVEESDFLVLAPAEGKGNGFSVGGQFLTNVEKTPPVEYVLVLVPLRSEKGK
jgi:hypothetical protein